MNLPAGLVDENIEFFVYNGEPMMLASGSMKSFQHFPDEVIDLIKEDMKEHPLTIIALEAMGISDIMKQIRQYIICRFGNFDDRADLTPEGITITEYYNCGQHGTCEYEGILCQLVPAPGGKISTRELQIIQYIARDLPNKMIADDLDISVNTVSSHIANIQLKTGTHSKAGIVAWASENHII